MTTNEPTECCVDDDGRTSCCGAYTSISMNDGIEYCKACYASVTGGSVTERFKISLDSIFRKVI